jgi:hypothetical protein
MTATFIYEPLKFDEKQRAALLASLAHIEQAERLLPAIADACGAYWAEMRKENAHEITPPAKETVAQLNEVASLSDRLAGRLSTLNIDAYWDLKLHGGERSSSVKYPLPVRDLVEAINWLRECAKRAAAQESKFVDSGRPKSYPARWLVANLLDLYPGAVSANDAAPYLPKAGKPRAPFQGFVAAVFKVCSCGVNPEQAIGDVFSARGMDSKASTVMRLVSK